MSEYAIRHFGKRPRIQSCKLYFISIFWHWTQFWIFRKFKFDLLYILSLQKFDMFSWSRSNENSKIENLWGVNTHFSTKLFCVSICILRFNQKWMWICECDWICWKMVKVGQVLFLTLLRNALWLSVYSTLHMCINTKSPIQRSILWSDGTREEKVMSNKAAGKLYRVSICITHFAMWTKRWTQELENAVLACSTCRWQTSNYTSTLS